MLQYQLQEIVNSYVECAIFTEEERLREENAGVSLSIYNLTEEAQKKTFADVEQFIKDCGKVALSDYLNSHDLSQLGHDLWLTRNRHGAGFFDRLCAYKNILHKAAQNLKECSLFISDSGKLDFE